MRDAEAERCSERQHSRDVAIYEGEIDDDARESNLASHSGRNRTDAIPDAHVDDLAVGVRSLAAPDLTSAVAVPALSPLLTGSPQAPNAGSAHKRAPRFEKIRCAVVLAPDGVIERPFVAS